MTVQNHHLIYLYALKEDWVDLLLKVESAIPIKYVCAEFVMDEFIVVYRTCLDLPSLGTTVKPTSLLSPRFLFMEESISLKQREVENGEGGKRFICDLMANPDAVLICPCGIYDSRSIIQGSISFQNRNASPLHKTLKKFISRTFFTLNDFYIGSTAMAFFRSGYRLTEDARNSLYDVPRSLIEPIISQ
jgi:hypothetical protein